MSRRNRQPAPQPQPESGKPSAPEPKPRKRKVAMLLSLLLALTTVATVWAFYRYYPGQLGPAQPISFSHRVHVTDKKLSCVFCHGGAVDGQNAGVPPVQTCMLCHSRIIVTHPQIQLLTKYYERREPVPWVRVNDLPDLVFFNHQIHTRRGFDCSRCHGNVAGMDRVRMATIEEVGANPKGSYPFKMGFCVQCHRDNGGSHDCLTCHR
jgi:hypothetical protein